MQLTGIGREDDLAAPTETLDDEGEDTEDEVGATVVAEDEDAARSVRRVADSLRPPVEVVH